jgi:alpha-L-fucosidase
MNPEHQNQDRRSGASCPRGIQPARWKSFARFSLTLLAAMVCTETVPAEQEVSKPTPRQEEFLSWKFGMFIHFGMATYHDRQWATGTEDPASFAPSQLDCNQWMESAAAAGMKYAVLTVKHTDGYCLWDSKHTTHDIASFKNFKEGKGDIVREFVDACRKHEIKVGIYYCFPGDFAERNLPEGEKDQLMGLPPEAKGDFTGFIKKQMTELLGNYGPIDLLWADQYSNKYTAADWLEIKQHIKTLQPDCLVIANNSLNFKKTDIHSYEYPFLKAKKAKILLPPEGNTHPAEVCDVIAPGWFWESGEKSSNLKPAEDLVAMLELCKRRRANYLLNVGPDQTGRLPAPTVEKLREIGRLRGIQP